MENKSSLAEKPAPPTAFLGCVDVDADADVDGYAADAGDTGAALFQPPKSSSALIFGVHPKPVWAAGCVEADLIVEVLGTETEGAAGSGVAQASLEPQGSATEKVEKPVVAPSFMPEEVGAGCKGAAGAERLNAELVFEGVESLLLGAVAGVDSEKSKRSFIPELVIGFVVCAPVLDAELKSPNPLEELSVR